MGPPRLLLLPPYKERNKYASAQSAKSEIEGDMPPPTLVVVVFLDHVFQDLQDNDISMIPATVSPFDNIGPIMAKLVILYDSLVPLAFL
eukprot:scaffold178847_cov56-Attheya_sp.AAC.2